MEPHVQALNKAKIDLMSRPDSAFFTTLCFSLKFMWLDSIPTAATDGRTIYINPRFFLSLPLGQQVFVLLHETLHCAYLHMTRMAGRNRKRWNHATDYVINLQLAERDYDIWPLALLDYSYRGMSAEQVYDLLPDVNLLPCDMEDLMEPADSDDQLSSDMDDILVRAAVQSRMSGDKPGTIPGQIEFYLDGLLNPKLPWQTILARYVQAKAKNDYNWKKPSRRFFPKHYLPSLHSEKLCDLTVFADVSCSVTDEEFKQEITEVGSIFRMMKPDLINLGLFDTAVRSVDKVRSLNELMNVKFTGRGGTKIEPVIEWANAHKPQLLLVLSDGGFRFHGLKTNVDTIWLIHDCPNFEAPFGKVIHYEHK